MAAFRGRCKNRSDAAIFEGRCSEPSCPRTPSQTDEVRCSLIMLSRRYRWLLTRMIAVFVWFLKGEKNDSDSGTVQSDACTVPNFQMLQEQHYHSELFSTVNTPHHWPAGDICNNSPAGQRQSCDLCFHSVSSTPFDNSHACTLKF